MRRWLSQADGVMWAARLLIAAGFVILILHSVNLREFRAVIIAPHWRPLVGMVVAALFFVFLGGVNVWIMLSALASVRFSVVLRHYVLASSLGTFTPAALGDFSLVGFLRREAVPVHRGLSAMLVDRGITVALNGMIYLPLTLLLVVSAAQWLWLPAALGVGLATLLGLNLVASFRLWLLERVVRPFLPRLEDFLRTCSDLLRFHPRYLLSNLGVTLVRSVVAGLVIELALLAAGTRAGFFPAVVLSNSLSLLNYLPISPSGVGVYEAGGVALFGQLGLRSERIFAAFVFLRAYRIASSLLLVGLSRLFLCAAHSQLTIKDEVKP